MDPVLCLCKLPAQLKTSHTPANPNRAFYGCAKPGASRDQCSFFHWADQRPPQPSQDRGYPPTPQSATSHGTILRHHESSSSPTPMRSSVKRTSSNIDGEGGNVPAPSSTQKRLKIIEAALAESSSSGQRSQAVKDDLFISSPNLSNDIADDDLFAPEHQDAVLSSPPGLNLSVPRAPSVRHNSLTGNNNITGDSWFPVTPPRSTQKPINVRQASPTRSQVSMSENSNTSRGRIGIPCEDSASFFPAPPLDVGFSSQTTLASDDDGELSADVVSSMIGRLGDIPEYIRKIESRKTAAEKSNDAKNKKIAHLKTEVERLKMREKELEDIIAAYEKS
ncbi:hypothetical protein B0H34DRAFT_698062 [Crassisporium funariophilum]|nr:hypothetical protein B0H34DRAFT_698062 [Crassisporium funariophilum]